MTTDAKTGAARAFVRSLNILLKFARLYEFGHARTSAQFEIAWRELRTALEQSTGAGLLLGASGNQILLDGVPLGSAAGERSFAQLLSASGIASIHFGPNVTQGQFARFVRAFPTGNAKPSALAEQLKAAMAGDTTIRVNEIRYVAEDSSVAGVKVAAQLTAKVLGASDKVRDLLEDPQKLLQLILASEGSRGGGGQPGTGGVGGGPGGGPGSGLGGTGGGSGSGGGGWGGGSGSGEGGSWGVPGGGSGVGWGGRGGGSGGSGAGPGGGGLAGGSGSGGGGGSGSGSWGGQGSTSGGLGGSGVPGGGGSGSGLSGSAGGGTGTGGSGGGTGSGSGQPSGAGSGGELAPVGVGAPSQASGEAGGRAGRWTTASAMLRSAMTGGGGAPGLGPISAIEGSGPFGSGGYAVAEEEVRAMLSLFAQLGRARIDPEAKLDLPTFQSRLSSLPVRAQYTLQQALAGLAAQAPSDKPDKPLLLKLAEHVAIRFALDSYERGEVRVNAVRQMLERLNQEIEALRKILSSHEDVMAKAGLQVQSFTELLDQEFWQQVPEENKREVLTSDEAWCVPPRNIRIFLEELLRRGELKTVHEILVKYVSCISLDENDARRATSIGLADLAELYGSGDGGVLMDAIRRVGIQLAAEREADIQTLVSAAFVRLSQEAASQRCYPAMQQALASLDNIEAQRPGTTQSLRPRIGVEERIPEFVEESLRAGEIGDGLVEILQLVPSITLHYITSRFSHCGFREDCELLSQMAQALGEDVLVSLMETLQSAPAQEAVETVGLLSRLSPETVEKVLPTRLTQWPRSAHDRSVRQLAAVEAGVRSRLLVAIYDSLDLLIRPLALDEMGMSGDPQCIEKLLSLIPSEDVSPYHRLKAAEALGRLRAQGASSLLQQILDARQMWRWVYPTELRIAAAQALMRIDPVLAMERLAVSGIDRKELALEPTDPEPNSSCIRQRRYARLKLSRPVSAFTTNLRENFKMSILELNLGGGLAACDRHVAPGTLLTVKMNHGLRSVRAQAIVRGVRPQAIAFEFVDMDLEERSRLRKIVLELGGLPMVASVGNRSRRRGRGALMSKN
jgi:hypothetical protein